MDYSNFTAGGKGAMPGAFIDAARLFYDGKNTSTPSTPMPVLKMPVEQPTGVPVLEVLNKLFSGGGSNQPQMIQPAQVVNK